MNAEPKRPDAEEEISEDVRRILDDRLRTFDEDVKTARPAEEVLAEIRANRKRKQPRSPR